MDLESRTYFYLLPPMCHIVVICVDEMFLFTNCFYLEPLPCDKFRVHFLPLQCSQELYKKSKYQKLFNVVYISNRYILIYL